MFRRPKIAFLCASVAVMAASPAPSQSEFRVNTSTADHQVYPGVAEDPTGRFVVVWLARGNEASVQIWMQAFSARGLPIGAETRVNTYTSGFTTTAPRVEALSSGGFVVTWERWFTGFMIQTAEIYAQRFDGALNPAGGEFRVNAYPVKLQLLPDVSADAAGNFVIVWFDAGYSDTTDGIFGRLFDNAGTPVGSEFRVSTYPPVVQSRPSVARSSAGFVVSWHVGMLDPDAGILAQRFSPTGAPQGAAFRVNAHTTEGGLYPDVAMDASGNFVIVWTGAGSTNLATFAQRFSATGSPNGGQLQVNATTGYTYKSVSAVTRRNADFVVVWSRSDISNGPKDIVARRFDASGAGLGAPFRVNTYTTYAQARPAIASTPSGGYVIVWQSNLQDGGGYGVFGQNFCVPGDANGDATINVIDILYVINHLFAGGPLPSGCADVDGNLVLNVTDVLYLINYLFAGGPPPV